jgi:hypothetical protein
MDRFVTINKANKVSWDTIPSSVPIPVVPNISETKPSVTPPPSTQAAHVTRVAHRAEVTALAFASVLLFVAPLLGVLPDARLVVVAWAMAVVELMAARGLAKRGRRG